MTLPTPEQLDIALDNLNVDAVNGSKLYSDPPADVTLRNGDVVPNLRKRLQTVTNAADQLGSLEAAQAAAEAAAAEAAMYDGPWVDDVPALLADTVLTYTTGTASSVAAGDYVRTRAEGFSYEVAASGATNQHVTTAGGVKLLLVTGQTRAYIPSKTVDKIAKTDDSLYVLLMGQSNAVGASPTTTGSVFAANVNVQVWNEVTSQFVVPTVGQEPFNPSGSNNAGLDFCNKLAEETGRQVRLILIATGSTAIDKWTGSVADRTISVGNRPRYVDLQTAMTAIGKEMDAFLWIQGEADGPREIEYYASEYQYLLSQLTADGYIGPNTPVVVSQLYQGVRGGKGNTASYNAVLANANIRGLLSLGDERLRIANTLGLQVQLGELVEATQTASAHFTDIGLRDLGRKRLWAAYVMALEGFQQPNDFGLEVSRTHRGLIGSHMWGGGDVDFNLPDATPLSIDRLGQLIDVRDGKTLVLPNFTHPTRYSSALKGHIGLCVYFRLTQVGSCTIAIEAGGTGGLVRFGALYGTGALEASITISAAGASNTNQLHMARWTGARWDIWRMSA